MKTHFFNAAKTNDTLTLSIYDVIGADMFGSGVTASQVQDALQGNHKNVTLRINSPGGDAFEGAAIYNLLASHGKPVNVIVDGLAASAASIICMAGKTITMNSGSMMMIHPAQGLGMGNADDMRKMAETLDAVTASIADIYVKSTGLPKDQVLDMMNKETWMSADEAKQNGFATAVSPDEKVQNSFDLSAFKFKNTPVELTNVVKTKAVAGEHLTAGDFIYVGDPDKTDTWSLPWHFSSDEKTKSHLRDALARFDQDEVIPEAHKPEAYAKLLRLCKEHGIEVSQRGNPKNAVASVDYSLRLKAVEVERRK